MRAIDIHAHATPRGFLHAVRQGKAWHTLTGNAEARNPRSAWTPEERIADMNSLGVEIQIVSTMSSFYCHDMDPAIVIPMHRECNDEVHQMCMDHPDRFAGLCNLPMQNIPAAIAELERGMTQLGMKGAMINDHVNGKTYDDPEFLPFWKAAEQMGAVILIHQIGGYTLVTPRLNRYHLNNTIGNLVDRAVTYASFVYGGVLDKCPDLRICLSHGGGYACYGIGRMDRGWQVRPEARVNINQPPSKYMSKFYYDCLTQSEPVLRYLIDTVGIDRVVFGTDWPADMCIDWPVSWILSLESLTQEEKEAILYKNLENLLGL